MIIYHKYEHGDEGILIFKIDTKALTETLIYDSENRFDINDPSCTCTYTNTKEISLSRMRELYPDHKITRILKADAMLEMI